MKKLMIAAVIVCATAISQAAQFTWKSDYSYVVDHSGNKITTSSGYNTLMGGSGEAVGKIVLVLLKDGTYSGDMTVLTGTSGDKAAFKTSGGSNIKYGTSATYTFSAGASSPIKDGDKIGVMYQDASGALSQLVYWDMENNKEGAKIDSIYTVSGMAAADPADTWSGADFKFATGTSSAKTYFTTQAVPEPTSAMLLLLGVAGLALKRRRA